MSKLIPHIRTVVLERLKELRRKQKLLRLEQIGTFPPSPDTRRLSHVAAFQMSNAGDVVLPPNLQDMFHTHAGARKWNNVHVHNRVTDRVVRRINGTAGLLIGGGGLLLRDTNPNPWSGWQWSCSMEQLAQIRVPIAMFAVGYNRFRGQPDFAPRFTDHVNALAEKSVYLGLRNHGSIEAMRAYLTPENQKKLRFQPCMTTVISRIYPTLADYDHKEPFVAFNAAFDRPELRFGEQPDEKLNALAQALGKIAERIPIKVYAHMPPDEQICPYLVNAGVPFELVRLNGLHPREIIRAYARPALAIGMRGHAQMIPFGAETPIVSIISHDKLRFFLDDIGRNEWGVDMADADFADRLVDVAGRILDAPEETREQIRKCSDPLWKISQDNVRDFIAATDSADA